MGATFALSGGGIVTWTGSVLNCTARVIAIPVNNTFGTDGYFSITISNITLASWTALYYAPPVGSGGTFNASYLKTFPYSPVTSPVVSTWIFICAVNSDGGNQLKWNPGFITIPAGGTYDSATNQVSWNPSLATAIKFGSNAGITNQTANSIAIGNQAGSNTQGTGGSAAIAIGYQAGFTGQSNATVAIGYQAGQSNQQAQAVAIGYQTGQSNQAAYAVALGPYSGQFTQQASGVAIGAYAGYSNQGTNAIAIGNSAGYASQGNYAIGIGYSAGSFQAANSIAINANSSGFAPATSGFFVAPLRSTTTTTIALGYNTATNEISATAAPPITLSSITATTATLSAPSYGYYYYITNSGFSGITLPASIPTAAGQFWVLRNTTATYLSVTVTNPTTSIISPVSIAPQTSLTIVVSGTGVSATAYVLF
jgi:hypothetical protein